VDTIAAVLV